MAGSACKFIAMGEVVVKVWVNLCMAHQDLRRGLEQQKGCPLMGC